MNLLALFASGTGSNVKNIIEYFQNNENIKVDCVVSNKANAGALEHAVNNSIDSFVMSKSQLENGEVQEILLSKGITHVILAGYLLKIPTSLIDAYPEKIINVHPSLLPKFGGKGMYGMNVHKAVVESNENESGISIHLVNEIYDDGRILAQFTTEIEETDSPEDVAAKIKTLEQANFPRIIEQYLNNEI